MSPFVNFLFFKIVETLLGVWFGEFWRKSIVGYNGTELRQSRKFWWYDIIPTGNDLGPVWLDQNWNRFQNPWRLFRPDFLKPNPDSWNHETSPGARFIGFKMADADGQVSGGIFRQFVLAFHNPQFHNKKLVKQHNDILKKIVRIKLINSDIWIKNRSRFCICFRETGFGFNILFVYNLMVSESGF